MIGSKTISCMKAPTLINSQLALSPHPFELVTTKSWKFQVCFWLPERELMSCLVTLKQHRAYHATCCLTLSFENRVHATWQFIRSFKNRVYPTWQLTHSFKSRVHPTCLLARSFKNRVYLLGSLPAVLKAGCILLGSLPAVLKTGCILFGSLLSNWKLHRLQVSRINNPTSSLNFFFWCCSLSGDASYYTGNE